MNTAVAAAETSSKVNYPIHSDYKVLPFTGVQGAVPGHRVRTYQHEWMRAPIESVVFDTFDTKLNMSVDVVVHWTRVSQYMKRSWPSGGSVKAVLLQDGQRIHAEALSTRYDYDEHYQRAPIIARDTFKIVTLGSRHPLWEIPGVMDYMHSKRTALDVAKYLEDPHYPSNREFHLRGTQVVAEQGEPRLMMLVQSFDADLSQKLRLLHGEFAETNPALYEAIVAKDGVRVGDGPEDGQEAAKGFPMAFCPAEDPEDRQGVFLAIRKPWTLVHYPEGTDPADMLDQSHQALAERGYDGIHDEVSGMWVPFKATQVIGWTGRTLAEPAILPPIGEPPVDREAALRATMREGHERISCGIAAAIAQARGDRAAAAIWTEVATLYADAWDKALDCEKFLADCGVAPTRTPSSEGPLN